MCRTISIWNYEHERTRYPVDITHPALSFFICSSVFCLSRVYLPKLSDLIQVESFYFLMRWRSVVSEQQHGEPGGTQITLVLSHWSTELLCCIKYEWEVGVRSRACSLRSVLRLWGFSGCKHNSAEVSILSATCVFYLPHRSLVFPLSLWWYFSRLVFFL